VELKSLAFLILGLLPALAQAKLITVQVNGMVCAFCAQGIEKKFKALPEVASIKVSLETKKVEVDTKEGKEITEDQIKKIITESGYEIVKIERAP
jgi:mercuric ion binding protein